ncbi:MAG: hypothetical protein JJT76_12885 [Clostridiaceae bacterium]|nr:hypothetical protein [Clostridiaceae bacterium]
MNQSCKEHLQAVLEECGIKKSNIFLSEEGLKRHNAPPYAAVLTGEATFQRDGSKVAKAKEDGFSVTRIRLYRKELPIRVLIAAKNQEALDEVLQVFFQKLGRRIFDKDNNAILIGVTDGDQEDQESKLNRKTEKELMVNFSGGVYQDKKAPLISIGIGDVEMEGRNDEEYS